MKKSIKKSDGNWTKIKKKSIKKSDGNWLKSTTSEVSIQGLFKEHTSSIMSKWMIVTLLYDNCVRNKHHLMAWKTITK